MSLMASALIHFLPSGPVVTACVGRSVALTPSRLPGAWPGAPGVLVPGNLLGGERVQELVRHLRPVVHVRLELRVGGSDPLAGGAVELPHRGLVRGVGLHLQLRLAVLRVERGLVGAVEGVGRVRHRARARAVLAVGGALVSRWWRPRASAARPPAPGRPQRRLRQCCRSASAGRARQAKRSASPGLVPMWWQPRR